MYRNVNVMKGGLRYASRLIPRGRPSPSVPSQLDLQERSVSSTPFVLHRTSNLPAAAKKLVRKEDLKQLSDQLKEMKNKFSNTMRFTIQNVLTEKIEAEVYCDAWPQFEAIAARITSPSVADVVLYTTSKERALGLLYDERILRCPGSHISGGIVFAELEDSLAEYLKNNMKSGDGRSVLGFDIPNEPMDKKVQSNIMQFSRDSNHVPDSFPCPLGYVIGSLRAEHATLISKYWRFKDYTRSSPQKFEFIIRNFQTSAAYPMEASSTLPDPVGWALLYPHGHIGNLHVLKDHQQKGLFKPIAWDLFKKVLSKEYLPELASVNDIVINAAKKNGFEEISKGCRLIYKPPN